MLKLKKPRHGDRIKMDDVTVVVLDTDRTSVEFYMRHRGSTRGTVITRTWTEWDNFWRGRGYV